MTMKPEEKIVLQIEALLSKCKRSYDEIKPKYPADDLRSSIIAAAGNILHSYHTFMCMTLDTVTEKKWWETSFGQGKPNLNDLSALKNIDGMIKHAFLVFFLSRIEWSMRKFIIEVFPEESDRSSGPFKQVYDFLFKKLGMEKYIPLYDLCRTIRNTMHNNGHYIYKSKEIEWNGKVFQFKHMQPIEFFYYELALGLYSDLLDSIDTFVNNKFIADLQHVPDIDQSENA